MTRPPVGVHCRHHPRNAAKVPLALAAMLLLLGPVATPSLVAATVDRYWEYSPYDIQLVIVLDTSTPVRERLSRSMPGEMEARARIAYGSLWKLSVRVPEGAEAAGWARGIASVPADQLATVRGEFDKLLLVVVRETPMGYVIEGTEYDCLLQFWGSTQTVTTSHLATVEDLAFATLEQVFSPIAQFSPDGENLNKVELRFRGAALPRRDQSIESARPQQIMRPYLREVDREGVPVEDGINPVSWTYLTVDPPEEGKHLVIASVYSHTRSPFGARRRGRVEQLAIAVTPRDEVTELRLHSSADTASSLAGFEVFQQNVGEEETTSIGKTDREGKIVIPPAKTPIQFALVRSGSQWIARIPIVAGYDKLVEAPLIDDTRRLEAAERLAAIHEEIIDVVARRKLIEARVKGMIKDKRFDEASKLVDDLDKLPNITYFQQQRLAKEALLVKSSDPRIQARIDKMFESTQGVLGGFLAPGLVQQLRNEIASAQEKTAQK